MRATICMLALLALPAAAQNGSEKSVSVGVYADTQAVKGETVYKATCAACHTPSDQSGSNFKLNWFGKTVWEYFINLKKTMPDDNPGGLSDDEYVRVVAYILKLNGFPPGADSLSADSTAQKLLKIGTTAGDTTKPRTR